ncbi:MAG: MBOAT family protein, partial [Deltaproteobacteria bacterium]|nr:MBOAT family protein [Deltaproteobacteria bacterium]
MLFSSYTFIVFFAAVLAFMRFPLRWGVKKAGLLAASYLFYAAWNPPFVILLWISTVADWIAARRIHESKSIRTRRIFLFLSLAVNLGLLCYFKYAGFLIENFTALMHWLHVAYQPPQVDLIIPLGISFYTFQTLSYTIDIYRGTGRPWHSFPDYALYVAFFPQLVAGPIVRAFHFLPQCLKEPTVTGRDMAWGLALVTLGLFEKVALADGLLAPVAEAVYDGNGIPDMVSSWCATVAFAGQIFCDFAGYSTCAIGVAACLGFHLPDNFNAPYAATGFSDFWRRWHISLSTWLRDYLYIPLGGNRRGGFRTQVNTMLTMLIGGLWHGASWTFVLWGGVHGIYLLGERFIRRITPASLVWGKAPGRFLFALVTAALVCVAWVFFRAHTLGEACVILGAMFGLGTDPATLRLTPLDVMITAGVAGMLFAMHWCVRDRTLEEIARRTPWWLKSL